MDSDTTAAIEPLGLVLAIIVAAVLSAVLVRIGILVSYRTGFVASPNPIVRSHTRPVAFGGGVVVVFVVVVLTAIMRANGGLLSLLAPVVLALIVGVMDDIYGLRPSTKMIGQSLAAIVYIALIQIPAWATVPILFFLVICQNAWNLIDVMDGLLGSIAAMSFLGIALIVYLGLGAAGNLSILAVITAGTSTGFLLWNKYPAKVYMGDSGSLPLGLLYGITVVELFSRDLLLGGSALLVGAVPFFELVFLIFVRWRKGIKVYQGSPDHFSMRMQCAGLAIPTVLSRVTALNSTVVLVSVALVLLPEDAKLPALSGVVLAVLSASIPISLHLYRLPVWGEKRHAG